MGDTIYWTQRRDFSPGQWMCIVAAARVATHTHVPLSVALTDRHIRINGVGEQRGEDFRLDRELHAEDAGSLDPEDLDKIQSDGSVLDYCKTRRMPYAEVVVQVLSAAAGLAPKVISWSRDPVEKETREFSAQPSPTEQFPTPHLSQPKHTTHMANQEPRGGKPAHQRQDSRPQQPSSTARANSDEGQNTGPEPVDTGVPSPFGKGTIQEAGNHFVVPGMEPSQVFKRINGKHLNVAEVVAIAVARRHDLEMPRFQFRKRTGEGQDARYDGNAYEATVAFSPEGKLRVSIPDRGEERGGSGPRQQEPSASRSGHGPAKATGVECALGPIHESGNKFLVGDDPKNRLAVYKEKSFREFSPEEMAEIINASVTADKDDVRLKAAELPVFEFKNRAGEPYTKRVGVEIQSGTMFTFDPFERDQERGRSTDSARREGQGRRGETAPRPSRPSAPPPEPEVGDFVGAGDNAGEDDIPDEINEADVEQPAPRRGRGR